MADNKNYKNYKKQTQRVRGGLFRSEHGETSEAIFMNSGYVFDSAEDAKARFAEDRRKLYWTNSCKNCKRFIVGPYSETPLEDLFFIFLEKNSILKCEKGSVF